MDQETEIEATTANAVAASGADDDDDDADGKAKKAAKKSARDRLAKARAELNAAKAECAAFGEDDDDESKDEDDDDDDGKGEDDDKKTSEAAVAAQAPAMPITTSRGKRGHAIESAARALTGKSDEGEIIGALTALATASKTNVSLSKRVADLERKLRRSEVESMVSRAIKAGKLAPAEREWALSYGMESPAKLRGYLDVTPSRANVSGSEHREPARPGSALDGSTPRAPTLGVTLSDEERRICANTGIDPEKFAAVKHRPIRVG